MLRNYKNISPKVDESAFVEDTAVVIGEVEIGKMSSVWFNAVIRGDVNAVKIGDYTNIQDGSILHVRNRASNKENPEMGELIIGDYVTVGHNVTLHACEIGNHTLIGMGSVVLDNAVIGEYSIVAAGAVVKEGFIVPPYTLVAGNPAVIKKELPKTKKIEDMFHRSAESYFNLIKDYRDE